MQSSPLGRTLFESNVLHVVSAMVGKDVQAVVDATTSADVEITKAALHDKKKLAFQAIDRIGGSDLLPSKRKIDIPYGELTLRQVKVSSFADEIDYRFASALKYLCVANELIKPLACECILVTPVQGDSVKCTITEEIYGKWIGTRDALNAVLNSCKVSTADDVQEAVSKEVSFP